MTTPADPLDGDLVDEISDALLTEDVEDGAFVDQPNGTVDPDGAPS